METIIVQARASEYEAPLIETEAEIHNQQLAELEVGAARELSLVQG